MSIRTDNDGLAGAAAPEASRAAESSRATGTDGPAPSPGAGGGDQIQISPLSEAIAAAATERTAMVQGLAAAYRSGGYQVDSTSLARALVRDALEAGGTETDR
jgi:anti-sigma28 factor (negative regulator of flagellin synthesis)